MLKKKRDIGNFYYNNLYRNNNISIQPRELSYAKNIYWVFGVLLRKKNKISLQKLQKKLLKSNIQTRSFFWPTHKQKIFKKMGLFKNVSLPNSEHLSLNGFYLPSGLGIKKNELKFVAERINKLLK